MPSDRDEPDWPSVSDAELELLKQLWSAEPSTVRQLHEALHAGGSEWAYTTVQTLLARLEEKGYVQVDRSGLAHVFRAAVSRESLLGRRLQELADKLCDGAAAPLLLNLVENRRFTRAEIARFRELLDAAARRPRRGKR